MPTSYEPWPKHDVSIPNERGWGWAPASVGNFICGFDALGVALEGPGDLVAVGEATGSGPEVAVHGDQSISCTPEKNTAAVAANAVAGRVGFTGHLHVEIHKGTPLSGGMGGSAASAVAAALAANSFLGSALSDHELLLCALDGEAVASGSIHGDNVAPSLLGGIVLCRTHPEVRAIRLPALPEGARLVVVHPDLQMETRAARASLGASVSLGAATRQWTNTATLVAGLYQGDWDLIGTALYDEIAEPVRKSAVPGFDDVKARALEAGALGVSFSGAGPSMFCLCPSPEAGEAVAAAVVAGFSANGVAASPHVGRVGSGARAVPSDDVPSLNLDAGFSGFLH